MHELFAKALRGEQTERPPVWLMRQAGRYLPRYRELRKSHSFREAISTPDVATEISLLPYEHFGVDGVIMYSDILTILDPLDVEYHLESGVGPVIDDEIDGGDDLPDAHRPMDEAVPYVGTILERLHAELGDDATTIGFAGGPFTVASYLVAGEPTRSHGPVRRLRMTDEAAWESLLDTLTEATAEYVAYQAEMGAEVIQLFDTYAGFLSPSAFREWLLPRHQRILSAVDVPTIIFARGMGGQLENLAATGADAVSLDWTVDIETAREVLGPAVPIQGNLDPAVLHADPATITAETTKLIDATESRGHVLNLGHGVDRGTPPEHVGAFVDAATDYAT